VIRNAARHGWRLAVCFMNATEIEMRDVERHGCAMGSSFLLKPFVNRVNRRDDKVRLKELLEGTKAVMRISEDKQDFWKKMDVAYPKLNDDNVLLPFAELPRLENPNERGRQLRRP